MTTRTELVTHKNRAQLAHVVEPPPCAPDPGALQRFLSGLDGCQGLATIMARKPTPDLLDALQEWDPNASLDDLEDFAHQLENSVVIRKEIRGSIRLEKARNRPKSDIDALTEAFLVSVVEDPQEKTKDRIKAAEVLRKKPDQTNIQYNDNRSVTQNTQGMGQADFVRYIKKEVLGVE